MGAVRPDILFPYLAGFNLAETFYLSIPALSWQTVVVGDPLCAPFARNALTRHELEAGVDSVTMLPAFFAKRRLARLVAMNPDVPEPAVALSMRSETLLDRQAVTMRLRSHDTNVFSKCSQPTSSH